MKIHIEDLKFQSILGILDFERINPQNIIVQAEITYEFKTEYINYALVVDLIKISMIENKYLLVEDALQEISNILKKKFPTISSLSLKITKPSILPDCRVSVSNTTTFIS